MQVLPVASAGLIGRLGSGGNPLRPDVLALPAAVRDSAIPLVFFDLEGLAIRRQAVGTVRYERVDCRIGWGFPDVSAVAARIVSLWDQLQRYLEGVSLTAYGTNDLGVHATKVVARNGLTVNGRAYLSCRPGRGQEGCV